MKTKQLGIFMVLLSLLVSAVTGCQPQFQPGTYTDDMGREVIIDEVPQRIVSHVPSITETLFALGLEGKVVGVSDYGDYPEEAGSKPSVGNYFNPSIERIVELDPDLVLTDGYSQNIIQLDSLGIKYMVLQPKDMDGIFQNIELLGKVTATERKAEKLIRGMQEGMAYVSARVKDALKPKVLYVFDATDLNNPWTAGPGSFADSLIAMAGGDNIAAKAKDAWVQFSIEVVIDADPEIFIIDGDLVNRPGPRIVQGLEEMARIIHPELFK